MSDCEDLRDVIMLIAVVLLILHVLKPRESMEVLPRSHERKIRGLKAPSVEDTQAMASSVVNPRARQMLGNYVDKYADYYA